MYIDHQVLSVRNSAHISSPLVFIMFVITKAVLN